MLQSTVDEAIKLYCSGMGSTEIGHQLGYSPSTILYHLHKIGFQIRTLSDARQLSNTNRSIACNINIDEASRLYKQGFGCIYLGNKYNCSPPLILKRLRDNGVCIRPNHSPHTAMSRHLIGAKHKNNLNHNWRGGIAHSSNGYVKVKRINHPNADKRGYVLEHRLVMSEYLQRPLKTNEVVHHLNGVKWDNRIENLRVLERRAHKTNPHHLNNILRERIKELEKGGSNGIQQ